MRLGRMEYELNDRQVMEVVQDGERRKTGTRKERMEEGGGKGQPHMSACHKYSVASRNVRQWQATTPVLAEANQRSGVTPQLVVRNCMIALVAYDSVRLYEHTCAYVHPCHGAHPGC